jgi:hypothetical protein
VLGCIGGGTLAVATGNLELLALKDYVGCGGNSNSFSSNGNNDDPIGNIINGLFR